MKKVFDTLANPIRLKIIDMLKDEDLTQGEILKRLNISQPALSYHLRKLTDAGVIMGIKRGKFVVYSLNMDVIDLIVEFFIRLKKGVGYEKV